MKLPQLTFTRFLAALLIVLLHLSSRTLRSIPLLGSLLHIAQAAVSYFFLLSGFILVMANATGTTLPARIDKRQFWINRFARIYPLYLFALLLTWLLMHLLFGSRDIEVGVVAIETSLLQAWVQSWAPTLNYPGWSLSVEAFFYLLFPFLYQWLVKRQSNQVIYVAVSVWLVNQLIYKLCVDNGIPVNLSSYWPLLHLSTFTSGVCLGILTLRHWQILLAKRLTISGLLVGTTLLFTYLIGSGSAIMFYYHNGLFSPLFAIFILFLSVQQGRLAHWLSHSKLAYLGEISYGIYLLQVPVGMAGFYLNQHYIHLSSSLYGLMYVGLLCIIAAFCFETIEIPGKHLVRQWLSRSTITTMESETSSQQLAN